MALIVLMDLFNKRLCTDRNETVVISKSLTAEQHFFK